MLSVHQVCICVAVCVSSSVSQANTHSDSMIRLHHQHWPADRLRVACARAIPTSTQSATSPWQCRSHIRHRSKWCCVVTVSPILTQTDKLMFSALQLIANPTVVGAIVQQSTVIDWTALQVATLMIIAAVATATTTTYVPFSVWLQSIETIVTNHWSPLIESD